MRGTRLWRVLPLIGAGFAAALALIRNARLVGPGFDGLYGQDAYGYLDYAGRVVALFREGTALGRFYDPLGFPLLGAPGWLVAGVAGVQWTVIAAGAMCVGLGGLLGYEVARAWGLGRVAALTALIGAALVMLACPQLAQSSIVIMSDAPALFWALLSGYVLLRYRRTGAPAWAISAAAAFALAVMTRWIYGVLAIPFGLALLIPWNGRHRPRPRTIALMIGVGLLAYAPQIVMLALDPTALAQNQITWSTANFTAHDFTSGDGSYHAADPPSVYYLLPVRSPFYTAAAFLPLIAVGAALLLRRAVLATFALGWMLTGYLYLAGIPVQNIRFALAIYAPFALAAGLGLGWAVERAVRLIRLRPTNLLRRVAGAALLVGALGCAGIGAAQSGMNTADLFARFLPIKQAEQALIGWLRAAVPARSAQPITILCLETCPPIAHYLGWRTVQIYTESPATLAARPAADRPAYAVLDLAALDTTWQGRGPQIAYRWLIEHAHPTPIATWGAVTLLRLDDLAWNGPP